MIKQLEVLLIEDNPIDIVLLKQGLEAQSFAVSISVAQDVDEAISLLEKQGDFSKAKRPNLIILDLNLPKDSGLKLLEFTKNDRRFKTIPVIVLTSSLDEQTLHESYHRYASCFINKPQNLSELGDMSKSIVDFWSRIAILPKNENIK